MNKSLDEKGPYPFVQTHSRSLRIFLIFLKILEVKRSISEVIEKWVVIC